MSNTETLAKPQVTFILPFEDFCEYETDVQIKLKIKGAQNMSYRDVVGLYPFHWIGLDECISTRVVPRSRPCEETEMELTFSIPKVEGHFNFQFCYLTDKNQVAGMSKRFRLVHKELADINNLKSTLGGLIAKQVQLETRCVEKENEVERLQFLAGKLLKDLRIVKEKKRQQVTDMEKKNELLKDRLSEREELMKVMQEQIKTLEKVIFLRS